MANISKIIGELTPSEERALNLRRIEVKKLLSTPGRIPKEERTTKGVLGMELGDIDAKLFKQYSYQVNRDTGKDLDDLYENELNNVGDELLRRSSPVARTSKRIASKKHKGILRTGQYTELSTDSLEYYAQELTYYVEDWPEQSVALKEAIKKVQSARTPRANSSDQARTAKIAPSYAHWLKHPNQYDINDVDTKGSAPIVTVTKVNPDELLEKNTKGKGKGEKSTKKDNITAKAGKSGNIVSRQKRAGRSGGNTGLLTRGGRVKKVN